MERRRRPSGRPPPPSLTRAASGPVLLNSNRQPPPIRKRSVDGGSSSLSSNNIISLTRQQEYMKNENEKTLEAKTSFSDFQKLIEENHVPLGKLSEKDAYNYFCELEEKFSENGRLRPQNLLHKLVERTRSVGKQKNKNNVSIDTSLLKPPKFPPPPPSFGKPKEFSEREERSKADLDHESIRKEKRRFALGDISALKRQNERVKQAINANQLSGRGEVDRLLNRNEVRTDDSVAEMMARRNTFSDNRSNSRPVVKIIRRHTMDDSIRKPPPPTGPPPIKNNSSKLTKPPPPSPKPRGPPPPNFTPSTTTSQDISSASSAASNSPGLQTRENFLLREKLQALETKLKHMEKDADLRQQDFNALQRELRSKKEEMENVTITLDALRERFKTSEQDTQNLKDELKQTKQEQKRSSRKSQQRFDAAIDFFKGILVDAKFPDLLQIIKSRIRVILSVERAEIYIVDEDNGELISYRERPAVRKALPNGEHLWMGRFPMGTGIIGAVIEDKSVQVVKDVEKDVRFDALVDGIGSNGVRNLVAYPIMLRRKVAAVIVVVNKLTNGRVCGEDFTSNDLSSIQDFATLSTLAFNQKEIKSTREKAALRKAKRELNEHSDSGSDSDI